MRNPAHRLAWVLLASALLFGCMADRSSEPSGDNGASSTAGQTGATGDDAVDAASVTDVVSLAAELVTRFPEHDERVEQLAEQAAKEGPPTLYAAVNAELAEAWADRFEATYPEVGIEFVRMSSTPLVERLQAEDRAGRTQADVVVAAGVPLAELWTSGVLGAHSDAPVPPAIESRFVAEWAVTNYVTPQVVAWNTDQRSAPESLDWEGLADGQLGSCAVYWQAEGVIGALLSEQEEADVGVWLDRFLATEPVPYDRRSSVPPALASGELGCAVDTFVNWVVELRADGAPIDWQAIKPAPASTVSTALVDEAPRPHAALLLMSWLLSDEAAQVVADDGRVPARTGPQLVHPELARFMDPDDEFAETLVLLTPERMLEAGPSIRRLREGHLAPLQDGVGD